jgi:hypothetical protein
MRCEEGCELVFRLQKHSLLALNTGNGLRALFEREGWSRLIRARGAVAGGQEQEKST